MGFFDALLKVLDPAWQRELEQRVTDLEAAVGGDACLRQLDRSLKARARLAERKLRQFAEEMPGHHPTD